MELEGSMQGSSYQLNDYYLSQRLRQAGHVARMEGGRNAFKILTGTFTRKRPLGRPRCRWEDNIKIDLKEIGINTRNWVDSARDRSNPL